MNSHDSPTDEFRTGGAGDLLDLVADQELFNPGDRIGPYRIESQLGQGGMATVYRAHRAQGAFDQTVAIKVLTALSRNEELLRRFAQEQQILAAMAHPNIATLLDGGVTEKGHPYLVMELVDGTTIAEHCQRGRLSIPQRLRLFIQVLKAVEYAHARMVVHRDIKPQNILVNADGTPMLLDFGIAKILDASDVQYQAEQTRTGIRVLTFEYAAPEQLLGQPISPATDIYQLGVLLYLLITGRRPYETHGMNPREAERLICETAPVPPSMAASVNIGPSGLPAQLDIRPRVLRRMLAGDLDTIVLTCLRHEPARRYESVSELISDLEACLAGRPISARRDSIGYRVSRFVNRHRAAVGVATTAVVALIVMTVIYLQDLTRARDRAELQARTASEITRFLTELIEGTDPYAPEGAETDVRVLIDRAYDGLDARLRTSPEIRAEVLGVMSRLYRALGNLDRATELARGALAATAAAGDADAEGKARIHLAGALWKAEKLAEAGVEIERLSADRASGRCCTDAEFGYQLDLLRGRWLRDAARFDEAEQAFRAALDHVTATGRGEEPEFQDARFSYAIFLLSQDRPSEAEPLLADVVRVLEQAYGPEHPNLTSPLDSLANARKRLGRLDEAEAILLRVLALRKQHLGEDHYWVANSYQNLAALAGSRADHKAMAEYAARGREIRARHFGDDSRPVVESMINEAIAYSMLGELDRALALDRQMLDILARLDPPIPYLEIYVRTNLGSVATAAGRPEEAIGNLSRAVEISLELYGADSVRYARARSNLAAALVDLERYEEAREHLLFALDQYLREYGADNARMAYIQVPLARAEAGLGNVEQARTLLDRAMTLRRDEYGEDHTLTAEVVAARAFVEHAAGNHAEAVDLAHAAAAILTPPAGKQDMTPVRLALLEADAAVASGRCEHARATLDQAADRLGELDAPPAPLQSRLTERQQDLVTCR